MEPAVSRCLGHSAAVDDVHSHIMHSLAMFGSSLAVEFFDGFRTQCCGLIKGAVGKLVESGQREPHGGERESYMFRESNRWVERIWL